MASVTDNLIYKCFGIPVEWIKKNMLRVRRLGLDPTPKRGARIGEMVNVA